MDDRKQAASDGLGAFAERIKKSDLWKRGISLFLACVMVVSALPLQVFSEEEQPQTTEQTEQVTETTVEPTTETTVEPTAETTAEPTAESTTESTVESTTESTTDSTTEATTEAPTENPPSEEPSQPEIRAAEDITNHVELALENWWYASEDQRAEADANRNVDFSAYAWEENAQAGMTLRFRAEAVAGDWFSVTFPEAFAELGLAQTYSCPDWMRCEVKALDAPDTGTRLTVHFLTEGVYEQKIPLKTRLTGDAERLSVLLRNDGVHPAYTLVMPTLRDDGMPLALAEGIALPDGDGSTQKITISGKIGFQELDGQSGISWTDLLRPKVFGQHIQLTAYYKGGQQVYKTQDDLPQGECYLGLTHNGDGTADFLIYNVPTSVTAEDGPHEVTHYTLKIIEDEEKLPYYVTNEVTVNPNGGNLTSDPLTMSVRYHTLTLNPTVNVPEGAGAAFQMNAKFTNGLGNDTKVSEKTAAFIVPDSAPAGIRVPVGIDFEVTQSAASGYELSPTYTLVKPDGSETTNSGSASGKMDGDYTVTTLNYLKNRQYRFTVNWKDNGIGRPDLTAADFRLLYRVSDSEDSWQTLDASAELSWNPSTGECVLSGLPTTIGENHAPIDIRVEPKELDGYTATETYDGNGRLTSVTYEKTLTFQAKIDWKDGNHPDRPQEIPLTLYRKTEAGEPYAVMTLHPNSNSIEIPNLSQYDDNGSEYEYYLVASDLTGYKAYYNNNGTNFANDPDVCHNGGTVVLRRSGQAEFSATKYWRDASGEPRPTATVTLWRYPKAQAESIDDAYKAGQAAIVIYRNGDTDVLLQYQLSGDNGETIRFDHTTVQGLPEYFKLPAYDEQGNPYVYFVRETVDSDNYEIQYSGDQTQGIANGGTITNVRREKALVTVSKVWRCPSDLQVIAGASVRMRIWAPLAEKPDGAYHELTVYNPAENSYAVLTGEDKDTAQTIVGFTGTVAAQDKGFYVNIYDEEGRLFDMEKAEIRETILSEDGASVAADPDGKFQFNGNDFQAETSYKGMLSSGGTKEYQYRQTNTITGKRTYQLEKVWDQSVDAGTFANVTKVNFALQRRSTKDGSTSVTLPETYSIECGTGRTWTSLIEDLDKYDSEGYAYQYDATEVSITVINSEGKEKTIPLNSTGWIATHYRNENGTKVVNSVSGGSVPIITISKAWNDNGDVYERKAVTVRIFRKTALAEALGSRTGEVSLDSLGSLPYVDHTFSENNWWTLVSVPTLNEKLGGSSAGDYLVLEYLVGSAQKDGAQSAVYSAEALRNACSGSTNSVTGTVYNSSRQYTATAVTEGNNRVFLTNTRAGQVTFSVTKTWKDEGEGRPDCIQFQVYQDGVPYQNETSGAALTVEGAEWDPATGILTVRKTEANAAAATWTLQLKDLPMFTDAGVPHTYNLEEAGALDNYISTKEPVEFVQSALRPDCLTYQYSFINTITGTISHTAYKVWKDQATRGDDRPDLYMTLYRYLKKDEATVDREKLEPFIDYKDQLWTANAVAGGKTYDWKITATGLPQYSDQGEEYVYFFRESMNNDGVNAYGVYQLSESTMTEPTGETSQVFANTLTDTMTIKGAKVWTGLEGYQTAKGDLPNPKIELYRSLRQVELQGKTNEEIAEMVSDGTITLVNTTFLNEAKNAYAFPYSEMTQADIADAVSKGYLVETKQGTYELPKFDAEGRRYIYTLRETMDNETADILYTKISASGLLTNHFRENVNRRSIAVTKTWVNRPEGERVYPSVTYTLYRYARDTDGEETEPVELKKVQISAATVKANAELVVAEGEERPPLWTFEDLLIYSPTGKPYSYYVTESYGEIGSSFGYTISYQDEEGIEPGYENNNRSDVISIPENALQVHEEPIVTKVGTTNTFDSGEIRIAGSKVWDDYGNSADIYGGRPDSITITLTRRTASETGQDNAVGSEQITFTDQASADQPYIVWDKPENSSVWTYTIYNLEQYAPNGKPYLYVVTEVIDESKLENTAYGQDNQSVQANAKDAQNGVLKMAALTNRFTGTYEVRKNWMDGNNKYGLRPESVTVVLQRSDDDGKTWQDIPWDNSLKTLPCANPKSENPVVSIKLTSGNVIQNTKGNSWVYTFTNLPTQDKNGDKWKYRGIETEIGGVEVNEENVAGAYTRSYPTQDATRTVIQNKLESTSLYVKKVWQDDSGNKYDSRPESLTFYLQMRGIVQNDQTDAPGEGEGDGELTDWKNVIQADGSPYTFTLTKADGWETTLQDLPVATVGANGKTYYTLYFRAVEKHADDTEDEEGNRVLGKKVLGAQNYEDTTNYVLESPDHIYNENLSRNESTITNRLIWDTDVTVNKTWYRQPGPLARATFELLYKTKDASHWHCYGGTEIPANEDWSGHTAAGGCMLKTMTSMTPGEDVRVWSKVPKYDREGNELEYTVVEHPLPGYKIEGGADAEEPQQPVSLFRAFLNLLSVNEAATAEYQPGSSFSFTNIELQHYTVQKIWKNSADGQDGNGKYSATFQLQQQIEGSSDWTDVTGAIYTLTSDVANDDTQSYTWNSLPKYTSEGKQITYRAVETKINGVDVSGDSHAADVNGYSSGSYIVTYQYSGAQEPAFAGTKTVATNRMVYGFVNLSKKAAYLAAGGITAAGDPQTGKPLAGVEFDIYSGDSKYVSGVLTDADGNLICTDGKYGAEQRYLVAGTYTLKEVSTNDGYSVWKNGVTFTVGVSGNTGEHGTAWIRTTGLGTVILGLNVEYKEASGKNHPSFGDDCTPATDFDAPAYNLESRGIIRFTKTGPIVNEQYTALDTHPGASDESETYFGVYLDAACTDQIAGMRADTSGTTMVLTTLAQDGSTDRAEEFLAKNTGENAGSIPYLRVETNGQLTLLSGTYYIQEEIAPPGYKLDTTVRTVTVPKLTETEIGANLTEVYTSNVAQIEGLSGNQWPNTPNQLTLYKRDQYGRIVYLGENGCLELTVSAGDFPTGGNTIRLYQNDTTPAKKADGAAFDRDNISYDSAAGSWTIKGLFDIGKTYTISEPGDSVPANNIQAKAFAFTMGEDGTITVTSPDAESKDHPLSVAGNDYKNYYNSDANNNVVVLRDVARYLKDVALKKIVAGAEPETPIQYISFTLWKLDEGVWKPVLEDGARLTTNAEGMIQLSDSDEGIKNLITGCDLRFGLDVGEYYFEEIEQGASDIYRLVDKVYFTITPKDYETPPANYDDYAQVMFTPTSEVSQSGEKTGVISNTPVTQKPKTLVLKKVNGDNEPLAGAQFTLTYTSQNHGQDGAQVSEEIQCKTVNGELKTMDGQRVSISRKGTYVLKETKAPDGYMTPTDANGNPIELVTFQVVDSRDAQDNRTILVGKEESSLVSNVSVTKYADEEDQSLNLTVKNEKTAVSVAKGNDIVSGTKTCDQTDVNGEALSGAELNIYQGTEMTDTAVASWTSTESDYPLPRGTLKENTIYTLCETKAPVGYLEANPIYFKLFGTATTGEGENKTVVSQLYVWTGEGAPAREGEWSKTTNLNDTVLTMVDEAIIAPVDLRKVVGDAASGCTALPGAEFKVRSLDGEGTDLGTAVTDSTGHLVWKTIDNPNGLIFHSSGKRVTSGTDSSVIGKTIILQQNTSGYQFTEIYAPDNAYNDGRSYEVQITGDHYDAYRTGPKTYDSGKYVNIAAEDQTALTDRSNDDKAPAAVNKPYHSTVTLHKYDADEEANKAAIPNTQFTLYHATLTNGIWTEGSSVGSFITDANGNLSIEIHNKGHYILKETRAAAGYNLDSGNKFTFTLIDGTAQDVANHAPYCYDGTAELTVDPNGVPNSRINGTVTLTKQDAGTGEKLNGVIYTLSRTDNPAETYLLRTPKDVTTGKTYTAYQEEDGTWKWREEDGMTGVLTVKGLNWGEYKLVEKTALSGYVLSAREYPFTISNQIDKVSLGENGIIDNSKNQVTFHKTDNAETPKNLAGAVFEVHEGGTHSESCQAVLFYASADATETVNTVTSGADGTVTIYGLPTDNSDTPKTYHLVETTAPKGYKIADPVTFTIDRYGKVRLGVGEVTEVPMQDAPIALSVEKVGEDTGTKLPGAEFTLTDICTDACDHKLANDALSETVTTGEDGKGKIPIERVIAGHTYRLTETKAPDGYECTAEITFSVNPNGTANLLTTTGGKTEATLDSTGTSFTVSNEKIRLTLKKVDYDDPTIVMKDVSFTLTPAEGSSFCGGTTEPISLTTDASGQITIPEDRLKHDNSYLLTEQDPTNLYPNYRYSGKETITFRVEKNGTLTITGENAMFTLTENEAVPVIQVTNQQISLSITKVDQASGQALEGVGLKLSKLGDGTWTQVDEWTTTTETKVFRDATFTSGTYLLEETTTPEGYNSIAAPLTFTIDPAGNITQAKVGEENWEDLTKTNRNFTITQNPADSTPGGIALTVVNAKASNLKIIKTEKGSTQVLPGVEFRLDYLDGSHDPVTKITDANGVAIFENLPDGHYRVTEVKTVTGYNLLSAPLEITIYRNSEVYTAQYGSTETSLTRDPGTDTIFLPVTNQKGLVLPATGTTTPQLPKSILMFTAILEGLVLYFYQTRGGRRKKKTA